MPTMEPSSQYPNIHSRQLFQSPQLPPPSQLHLSTPSFSRSNTLPPIPNFPSSSQLHRFPPVAPYPGSAQVLPPLPSPPASQHNWPTLHRTSNSRDEIHPSQRRNTRTDIGIKHEPGSGHRPIHHDLQEPPQQHQAPPMKESSAEDGMPSTSDFVKKLYKMLEDQSFHHVVSWAPQGDCFVVKDMNEFTKSILPRMFKHSNFASFVRQLNKYDFHKVKNTDDNQFGEHSWIFQHPNFHADRRDALENIKRKVPAQRKPVAAHTSHTNPSQLSTSPGPGPYTTSPSSTAIDALQAQVDRLTQAHDDLSAHFKSLERNYQDVLREMVNFQRNMAQQDGLMQNLIQYFLHVENGKSKARSVSSGTRNGSPGGGGTTDGSSSAMQQDQNPFLAAQEAQQIIGGSYTESDIARASLVQMNEISRRAEVARMSFGGSEAGVSTDAEAEDARDPAGMLVAASGLMGWDEDPSEGGKGISMSREEALTRIEELQRSRPSSAQGMDIAGVSAFGSGVSECDRFVIPEDSGPVAVGPNGEPDEWVGSSGTNADTNTGVSEVGVGEAGAGGLTGSTHQGLQVYTLGHLMPRSTVVNGNWSLDPNGGTAVGDAADPGSTSGSASVIPEQPSETAPYAGDDDPSIAAGPIVPGTSVPRSSDIVPQSEGASASTSSSQKLRVRRSTFVPGWAVPPRVLLVDDDAVSRKLSSKFLQVFGCTIDVAVDGVGAVNKMNLEKYDLVLMDIVMPKLDGVSATSLIRQFDHMTPIISMTSNSKPNEIMTYYHSGMNDILPKPFTKEGLLDMLEKHLMHLKVIQQMSKVPRSVGIPPLSDSAFEEAFTSQTSDAVSANPNAPLVPVGSIVALDEDGRINPLAGMGLTDEQYAMILQGLVNGESFPGVTTSMGMGMGIGVSDDVVRQKRALDDLSDGRDGKRGRFELVE